MENVSSNLIHSMSNLIKFKLIGMGEAVFIKKLNSKLDLTQLLGEEKICANHAQESL